MAKYIIKPMNTTDGKVFRIYQDVGGGELIPSIRFPTYYKKKANATKRIKPYL